MPSRGSLFVVRRQCRLPAGAFTEVLVQLSRLLNPWRDALSPDLAENRKMLAKQERAYVEESFDALNKFAEEFRNKDFYLPEALALEIEQLLREFRESLHKWKPERTHEEWTESTNEWKRINSEFVERKRDVANSIRQLLGLDYQRGSAAGDSGAGTEG